MRRESPGRKTLPGFECGSVIGLRQRAGDAQIRLVGRRVVAGERDVLRGSCLRSGIGFLPLWRWLMIEAGGLDTRRRWIFAPFFSFWVVCLFLFSVVFAVVASRWYAQSSNAAFGKDCGLLRRGGDSISPALAVYGNWKSNFDSKTRRSSFLFVFLEIFLRLMGDLFVQ